MRRRRVARWGVLLAVVLAAAFAPPTRGDAPPALGLADCYRLALDRSERIGIAAAEWRAAEARYRQARDSWLPDLGVSASAEFQNDRREGGSDGASRAPEAYEARLTASQSLYRGFRSTRIAEAREAEGRAARLDERRVREVLYLDVSDAFHELLLVERDLAVLDRLVGALEQAVAALDERVRLGRSRRAELLKARSDLAEARVEQEASRGRAASAREVLAFLTGVPAAGLRVAEDAPFPVGPDLQERLAAAARRADLQAGEARAEAARRDLQAARGERQPEVSAGANLYLYEDPDEDRSWNAVVTMSLPMFDDGAIRSRVREQAERLRISELNLSALRRSAALDVRSAYAAFASAVAQKARLDEARSVARENYEVQDRDYEMGRASQLDALNALAQWQRLERRASAAEVQARASLVRLHVAAGEAAP